MGPQCPLQGALKAVHAVQLAVLLAVMIQMLSAEPRAVLVVSACPAPVVQDSVAVAASVEAVPRLVALVAALAGPVLHVCLFLLVFLTSSICRGTCCMLSLECCFVWAVAVTEADLATVALNAANSWAGLTNCTVFHY